MNRKQKISIMQTALTVLYVISLVISNIVVAKQFVMFGGITMTCAMIVFPITYILSDVFSEVYGYKWSRFSCYLAFGANILMVLTFELSIALPAPDFWNNQEAFETVLGNSPRILIASVLAFVCGDFVNDKIFAEMKKKHKGELKGFKARAMLSSVCGQLADSAIFMPIAFIGVLPAKELVLMGITEILLKSAYELIILPLTHQIAKALQKYEASTI